MFASGYCNVNGCMASDIMTNNVPDGYKVCTMGDGAMNTWNQLITVWRQNVGYDASGNVIAGTTADGRAVQFDFEGSTSGWTSGNTQLAISSSSDVKAQTGSKTLKVNYTSGSTTVTMSSATNLSIPSGKQVTFYLWFPTNSILNRVTPWVRKNGGATATAPMALGSFLRGSWNVVNITVPSGVTANQVGVDFNTAGAFTAYVDSVTW
jgi:hypothetical protein